MYILTVCTQLKLYLLLLCQMRDINSMRRGNALAPNRRNSLPCTVRTSSKGRATKGLVVCNNWDLEPLDLLNGLALGCYQPSPEVLIVLRVNDFFARDRNRRKPSVKILRNL